MLIVVNHFINTVYELFNMEQRATPDFKTDEYESVFLIRDLATILNEKIWFFRNLCG